MAWTARLRRGRELHRSTLMPSPLLSRAAAITVAFDAFDRLLDAVVGHAAAEREFIPCADLGVGWVRGPIEQRFRGEDLAVLAEPALRHLLVDPRLLQRMQLAVVRESLERRDLAPSPPISGGCTSASATPLIRTVHAPHWPSPQPKRGPRRSRSFRRTYKRGVGGVDVDLVGRAVDA